LLNITRRTHRVDKVRFLAKHHPCAVCVERAHVNQRGTTSWAHVRVRVPRKKQLSTSRIQ
jgi:hypothetical protein